MSFQCYFSTNPAYDWRQRVEDFWFALVRAHYGSNACFNQLAALEGGLSDIVSRTHWVAPPVHQIDFQSFDLVKAILKLDEAIEEVEKNLLNRPSTKYRIMAQYSSEGYRNLNYGEVI